jgi:hypothetical protein
MYADARSNMQSIIVECDGIQSGMKLTWHAAAGAAAAAAAGSERHSTYADRVGLQVETGVARRCVVVCDVSRR